MLKESLGVGVMVVYPLLGVGLENKDALGDEEIESYTSVKVGRKLSVMMGDIVV